MKLKDLAEGMDGAEQARQQRDSGTQQNPRLAYSQAFMKNKDTLNRIAQALDFHAKQDRGEDVWGKIGDMTHIGEELENILNFLTRK